MREVKIKCNKNELSLAFFYDSMHKQTPEKCEAQRRLMAKLRHETQCWFYTFCQLNPARAREKDVYAEKYNEIIVLRFASRREQKCSARRKKRKIEIAQKEQKNKSVARLH